MECLDGNMKIDGFNGFNDLKLLLTVLDNTKKTNKVNDKPKSDFAQMIAVTKDPVRESEITRLNLPLDKKPMDTSCIICGKPGKYFNGSTWRCEEHKDTVLSDALCKDIRIKEELINGIRN